MLVEKLVVCTFVWMLTSVILLSSEDSPPWAQRLGAAIGMAAAFTLVTCVFISAVSLLHG